ncbi:dihydrolipoyl dehydrogenase [candidate division KSB3 bacterium]|uniref:Dihydrolipoyl dehydrogenase n=1 Tax=candidate division KSB3 bacterium TaxID=2044937 RepID=A0A2G6KAW3_9BACT|nr:MAG: dihydrolipoyl dehydrogenase [candidate division KSB3 bacterium]
MIVVGSGPGGYVTAVRAAQLGLTVAIVEKRATLGGTCLNIGCIPSKALLESSELYARMLDGTQEHGIDCKSISIDIAAMMRRKEKIVERLTKGVSGLMKKNKIDVWSGEGRVKKPQEVCVSDAEGRQTTLQARDVVIATGSVSQNLPFLPFDEQTIVTSTEALSFETIPQKLIVVGAGAIGLELGSIWARLGTKVTVIELLPQILPGWDSDISKSLARELQKQGLDIHLSTTVTGADVKQGHVVLRGRDKSGKHVTFTGDKVLVAVGRKPCLDGIDSEALGLEFMGDSLHLKVDTRYQTNVPHLYAIGDLIHGPMLAHKAEEEGVAVAEFLAGKAGHVNYGTIPSVVYTWPEAAGVGATEVQLKAEGIAYNKGQFPFSANGRAVAMSQTGGFVKVLAEKTSDRIIGVHILGPWASDLIEEAVVLMEFGGSAEDLARTIHPHPTLSEAVKEAALGVARRMIHL